MNHKLIGTSLAAIAFPLTFLASMPSGAAAVGSGTDGKAVLGASAKPPHYSSCTALTRDWRHGVARSKAAAKLQVRQGNHLPNYGPRGRAVYRENSGSLDRDRDGTACEN